MYMKKKRKCKTCRMSADERKSETICCIEIPC